MKKVVASLVSCFLLDRIVKLLLAAALTIGESINIIKNFFSITFVTNTGAAFSILSSKTFLLIVMTIFIVGVIYYVFIRNSKLNNFNSIVYGMLLGGILGNFFDRIYYGYVIDFLDFNIFGFNFPVFNLADIFIVISIFIIMIQIIKGEKNEVQSRS